MVDDKRDRDTPPTGTAIPRPRSKLEPVTRDLEMFAIAEPTRTFSPDVGVRSNREARVDPEPLLEAEPAPPSNPTIEDVYRLIDRRLSPKIVHRISSMPPPGEVKPERRESMPVRAAKQTGRWGKGLMTITGGLLLILQGVAWVEEYRGPIQQAVAVAGKLLDLWEANRVLDEPAPGE